VLAGERFSWSYPNSLDSEVEMDKNLEPMNIFFNFRIEKENPWKPVISPY
jgi:hypothetical protein